MRFSCIYLYFAPLFITMDYYMTIVKGQCFALKQGFLLKGLYLIALALTSSKIALASPIRDNSPILDFSDQVRLRHLYADDENTYLHLQITPEGEVSGTKEKNLYSLMEIKAIKPSILAIQGKKTTLYLCMNPEHHLYGSKVHKEDDCNFREIPQADGYNLYYSEKHLALLSLTPTRGGHQFGRQMVRFIPLENSIPLESLYTEDDSSVHRSRGYIDIADPFGMIGSSNIYSPSLDS